MGFKKSTSFKVMPGVRVRVSTNGVSVYAGRTKIAGTSSSSRSSQPPARRAPARAAVAQAAVGTVSFAKPGLFAPREEKALYAYAVTRQVDVLDPLVLQHPVYAPVAAAVLGIRYLYSGDMEQCVQTLQSVVHGLSPIESYSFVTRYLATYGFDLEIAGGVSARFPLSQTSLILALAEALQSLERIPEAIQYIEQLDPSYPALLSLAELYSDLNDWTEVIRLTDTLPVDSEITALLAIMRSRAHLNLDQLVAAKECLKPLTASKKYSDNIRFKALAMRSDISFSEKAYTRAIADLEKILSEDSQIPGIREALQYANNVKAGEERQKAQAAQEKASEALRVREEKEAAALRLREEKQATALRLREEKQAAALRLREEKAAALHARQNPPVMQAGIINLSDDVETVAPVLPSQIIEATVLPAEVSTSKEPGFYPDPEGVAPFRFWDGSEWTSRIRMTPQ